MTVRRLIFLLLLPAIVYGQQQYYGTRAGTVTLTGVTNQSDLQLLPLKAGDLITVDNVRASVQALYDTGRYRYVEVDASVVPGGTRLEFRVRPHFFFSTITLQPEDLLDRPLSGLIRLPYGEKFSQSVVDRLTSETVDLLRGEGYFEAIVTPDLKFDEATRVVIVTLVATNAVKAIVGNVSIAGGEETFPERRPLEDAFELHTGDKFHSEKLDKGIRKLREKFVDLKIGSFLNTRVDVNKDYHPDSDTVDLAVTVQPGVFTLVEVIPNDLISQDRLKQLVPIYEEGAVDDDLIEEGRSNILSYMQQNGYFEATVDKERIDAPLDNAVQINYRVEEGRKHEIRSVEIEGNYKFKTDEIKSRMKVKGPSMFRHGVFSPALLDQDKRSIEAMYRNAGYEQVVVTTDPQETDHAIDIVISIQEGATLSIDRISIDGNAQVPETELRDRIALREGEVYTPAAVDSARNSLTSMYYAKGFPDARVEQRVNLHTDQGTADVAFRITEGESYQIGKIVVEGNTITADKVVRRYANLYENTPFNPEAILDSQRRLYSTGLFNRVDVVPVDVSQPGVRNVLIQIEDAKPLLLTPSIGYQGSAGARGTFDVSHTNLFGLSRSLDLRVQGTFLTASPDSNRDLRAQATYTEPRLFNHDLNGVASLFWLRTHRTDFDAKQLDASLQVVRKISEHQNLLFTSGYQNVNLKDIRVSRIATNFPDEVGIVKMSTIGAAYIRDRRDDPINPHSGTFHSTTFQLVPWGTFYPASANPNQKLLFTSLFNQSIFAWPHGSAVIAASTRTGWNQPIGNTFVPINQRYFAGGSTTLRGFGQDKAGPAGGANFLAIANLEYRKPFESLRIKNIGGVLFYDTGNIFRKVTNLGVNAISHSVGAGLRYNTPVGPVRFDVGYRLYPGPNVDQKDKRLHFFFTLGQAF